MGRLASCAHKWAGAASLKGPGPICRLIVEARYYEIPTDDAMEIVTINTSGWLVGKLYIPTDRLLEIFTD
jgi:hypothetical protein